MTGWRSLEEALTLGYGIERAFVCPVHGSDNAHASVNSLNGLWFCYSCKAAGKVDLDTLDFNITAVQKTIERLEEILTPPRTYSESYLNLFDASGPGPYWLSRYSEEVCKHFRLGQAPDGTYATIPIRNVAGHLLGVVRRDLTGKDPAKYRYPTEVKMSDHIFNLNEVTSDTIVLVEGATDAVAAAETGRNMAVGMYGSSCSYAQRDLIRKYYPGKIVVAFDQDEAGDKGYERVNRLLGADFPVVRLTWDTYKDISEMPLAERQELLEYATRADLPSRSG